MRSSRAAEEFEKQNILTMQQFTRDGVDLVHQCACQARELLNPIRRGRILQDYILSVFFCEPSTRTRIFHDFAFRCLGGSVQPVNIAELSRKAKNEADVDTMKILSSNCDVIVIRHGDEQAVKQLAEVSEVPVINGGNGQREHPTQALGDTFALWDKFGRLDGLTVAIAGDLLRGRAAHSLAIALSLYDVELRLIAPGNLQMPGWVLSILDDRGVSYEQTEDFERGIAGADAVYMTRKQYDRNESEQGAEDDLKPIHILTPDTIIERCPNAAILHPLPRNRELPTSIDEMPNAEYFGRQKQGGKLTKIALFGLIFGKEGELRR